MPVLCFSCECTASRGAQTSALTSAERCYWIFFTNSSKRDCTTSLKRGSRPIDASIQPQDETWIWCGQRHTEYPVGTHGTGQARHFYHTAHSRGLEHTRCCTKSSSTHAVPETQASCAQAHTTHDWCCRWGIKHGCTSDNPLVSHHHQSGPF